MIGEATLDYNAFYRVYEKVVAKREQGPIYRPPS